VSGVLKTPTLISPPTAVTSGGRVASWLRRLEHERDDDRVSRYHAVTFREHGIDKLVNISPDWGCTDAASRASS
jgi:hypothetical protein